MDFRLETALEDFMKAEGILNDADVIAFAGAAKNINDEKEGPVIKQLQLSNKLHDIKTVFLINHTDCGGYGGREAFNGDRKKEWAHHTSELEKAKTSVQHHIPNVAVRTFIADIQDDETVQISEIK